MSDEQETRAAVLQYALDRGKAVWVVFGVYNDRSGSKLFGVYTDQAQAAERVKMAKEAGAIYSLNYARMPLDQVFGVDLNP
jgi:hypothetical protein